MKLSIGRAWDDAKFIAAKDGSALVAIGAATLVLPSAILETVSPSTLRPAEVPIWISLMGLLGALFSLVGQLAVSRIALGPPTTVGGALGHSFRRLPVLAGALLLVALPLILAFSAVLFSQGGDFDPRRMSGGVALGLLLVMLVGVYVLVRMLFLTQLAIDRTEGPVALMRESWQLTRGRWPKLFALVVLLLFVAFLLVGGLAGAIGAVIILALGEVAPGNTSAVLVALVQSVLGAVVSVLFVCVVARLYAQARDGAAGASVPNAGGE